MVAEQSETRGRYDETAEQYDRRYSQIQRTKYPVLIHMLSPLRGCKILDWGCGTGLAIPELEGAGAQYFGIDYSMGMLSVLRRKHMAPVVLGDCGRLPFKASAFHRVFAATVLQNLSNKSKGLTEISRVLRKGGRAAISYPKRTADGIQTTEEAGLKQVWTQTCGEDLAVCVQKDPR